MVGQDDRRYERYLLDRRRFLALGGGAALEGDVWVIGYFVDFGMDVMRLSGPGDPIHGSTPYVMFGGKVGWL